MLVHRITAVVVLALPVLASAAPPSARVATVVETHHGVKVSDPYRWMEDLAAPETVAWIKGQADHAQAELAALPKRDELLARLVEVSAANVRVRSIRYCGEGVFYLRQAPDEQDASLYYRESEGAQERRLVDPASFKQGGRWSIAEWAASHDCSRIAYTLSAGGSEEAELRVRDVATAKDGPERIDRTRFGGLHWLPDNRSFFYIRSPEVATDAPQSARYQQLRTYLHVTGTDPARDRPVFGHGVDPAIPGGLDLVWEVETLPGWDFALGKASTGVTAANEYFVVPLNRLDEARVPWRKIVSFEDEVSNVAIHGDDLFLLSFRDAPRYRVLRTSLAHPDLHAAKVVVPATAAVVTNLAAQSDALYVERMAGGDYAIDRFDYETESSTRLALPHRGSVAMPRERMAGDGVSVVLLSWTRPTAHYRYTPAGGARPTGLMPPHPVDMSGYEFVNAQATSHDGTRVPLVIIHRRGLKRDGSRPVLMHGYGAYGMENTSPFFDTESLPWLEQGGIVVWAGVRGGGEFGEEWHAAGRLTNKPNTWKDFIACAEYLVAERYTAPGRIGMVGASAGGVLVGNALVERPDLFGAAVAKVGLMNPMRAETTSNGVGNVPQFGTVSTRDGFRALHAMDAYLRLRDGIDYPAVLVTTGINDKRVDPWHSAKFVARLQAASRSGKPALLRVDYDAGHGAGSTRDQQNRLTADVYAFLLANLREKGSDGD